MNYRRVHLDEARGVWQLLSWDGAKYSVMAEYGSEGEAKMYEQMYAANPYYSQAAFQVGGWVAHR